MGLFNSKPRSRRSLAEQNRSKVFSYHNKRSLNSSSNTGRRQPASQPTGKKLTSRRQQALNTLIVVLAVGLVIYSLVLDPSPRLRLVHTDSTVHRSIEVYQSGVAEILRKDISNRSKITTNTNKIKQEILAEYPELANAEVSLPIVGKKPFIVLTPENASLLINNKQGSFYISDQGKVLAKASDVNSQAQRGAVPELLDQSGLELTPGSYALSQAHIKSVDGLVSGLGNLGYEISSLVLPTVINEIDIELAGKPYVLKFSLQESAEQGVGAYAAFLKTLQGQPKPKEYVDLRVPEKVFYK